jgi:hypothetical protein
MNWLYVIIILGSMFLIGSFTILGVWIGYKAGKGEAIYEADIEGEPIPISEDYELEEEDDETKEK